MIDLDNIEKTEHYQIPDNYFEELSGRVMQNIRHEQRKRKTFISSAVAAIAVIVIAVGIFFTYNTPEKSTVITQTQQVATANTEEELLEAVATEYYSEELAMLDYYQYMEY